MVGIYSITNKTDGKRYIGQSKNIYKRLLTHCSKLRNNVHPNDHLQNAWNKYGEDNFELEVLAECDAEQLDEQEKYYIEKYKANDRQYGYCYEGGGSFYKTVSDETRQKLSDKFMGHEVSEETRRKLSKANVGKKMSDEVKAKIFELGEDGKYHLPKKARQNLSAAMTGRHLSEEIRKKISNTEKGKVMSEETRKKLSEALTGRKFSEEHKQKLKNRIVSEDTRQKISAAKKGHQAWNIGIPCTEEQKRQQSEVMRGRISEKRKRVKDLTTGIIYDSVQLAQELTGAKHVSDCARGLRNVAGGHKWAYV